MNRILLTIFLLCSYHSYSDVKCEWRDVEGISIPIPPSIHPRLYIQQDEIAALKQKMKLPVMQKLLKELDAMKSDWDSDKVPEKKDFRFYFNQKGATVRAQLNALDFLVNGNKDAGKEAVTEMLDTLQRCQIAPGGDITRAWGLMLTCGAMVYDWCYPLLTAADKKAYVDQFIRIAKELECGYPPTKQSSVTGHSSEWMIMRDMLSAGIAIYDEYPDMYRYAATRFFSQHLPARNYFYSSHNFHQGTSYFNVRFANDLFATWIFDKMGAANVYNPAQQFVLYDIIYRRRPDNQVLPAGDENQSRTRAKTYSLPMLLASSYYKDEYLNEEFMIQPRVDAHCKIFELLWRDTSLGAKKPYDLPYTRFFDTPFGWMIARTGWGANSVIAEMKVNEYNFANHQHLDAGTFQIYYKGPLATDSGTYQGTSGGYNSPHNKNYFKRTIAHNGLLIYDKGEKFECWNYGGGEDKTEYADNDGGERMPGEKWGEMSNLDDLLNKNFKTATTIAYDFGPNQFNPEFSYLKGDITEAYSSKVKEVKRSFVFLNMFDQNIPAAFIVFDKVVAADSSFKKFWLLHSIEQPKINGNQIVITRTKNGDSGALINTVLLPSMENATIESVGGEGREFWVFGKNYPNIPSADEANERSSWRIELCPRRAERQDTFLNVMQITNNDNNNLHKVIKLESDVIVGAQIANRVVTFSKQSNIIQTPFVISVKGNGIFKFVITDLMKGTWQVKKDGKVFIAAMRVVPSSGVLCFEGEAGDYQFLR